MAIKIAGWNGKEGLAQALDMPLMVKEIERLDADVVVISDAYSLDNTKHGSRPDVLDEARAAFESLGYARHEVEYGPRDKWHHDRNMVVLNRLDLIAVSGLQLATRKTLDLRVCDPHTKAPRRIIPYHGDDRSAETRVKQIEAFLDNHEEGLPTVIGGDFNDTHHEDRLSRIISSRTMRAVAHAIPAVGPFGRARSIATRLTGTGIGTSVALLEGRGFRDADPTHAATFLGLQLDRAMLSPELHVADFQLGNRASSDHVPTLVTIES